jgi:N-acetylglucosamine-6-sulfatase
MSELPSPADRVSAALAAVRRRPITVVVLATAVLVLVAALAQRSKDEVSTTPANPTSAFREQAPNVVVVMTDDQAVDTMKAMPRTRRMLGGKGVTFENSFVSYPLCCPSRASFQTGQYAHNHGVLNNQPPKGGYQAFDAKRSLPVWLSEAGYRTGFVGKYLNGYGKGEAAREVPPGWSDWYGLPASAKQRPFEFELNENGELVDYGRGEYKTEVLEDKAVSLVREWAGPRRPFFLWVATDAPHKDAGTDEDADRDPEPAPRDRGRFERENAPRGESFNERDTSDKPGFVKGKRRLNSGEQKQIDKVYRSQLESLIAVDRLVKSIVKELRRRGELENTVVMFTSDNGFIRGQHRIESGKASLYDEAIRVPLLVRGPGFPEGERDERVVGNVDLAPTILDLAAAEADIQPDGVSLLPFEPRRASWRPNMLLEVFERDKGNFVGIRTPRFSYAEYTKKDKRELYDLYRDPKQLDNLAGDPAYADELERLHERVTALRDCAGADCR